jgi:predicted AAA+ superfamily ATPase
MYELFPFSFYEMLHMRGIKPSSETFMTYCRMGGFPEFLKYENIEILHQLFRDIITRDIIGRYQIREPKILLELAVYLITNTGKEFTFNRLKNHFQLGSINTAIAYVAHLEECFLFFTLPKFDYSFSKQRTHAKKIYAIDPGLIRANSVLMSEDSGRIFENIVFLELRRRYQEIFYFKNNDECDFLVKTGNSVEKAIQVCYQLTEENISREMIGLREASI